LLSSIDNRFIFELFNSEDFIKNIGNRDIKTADDSKSYINKILKNKNIEYNVIEKIDSSTPIGILSYVKRDYLEIHDFGFALLPEYYRNGYALEASNAYLQNLFAKKDILKVAAISKNDNKPSLKLLEKLGFEFSREIEYKKESIQVFILSGSNFL
jgi:RimJ/RimL family protein N-acetyltransferase